MRVHSSAQNRGSFSFLAVAVVLLATSLAGGCAQRILRIETEPSGALVFMDNREIGRTPIEMPFVYGGLREFLILKDERGPAGSGPGSGPMKPLIVRQNLENFWFDTFPFDVFVELTPLSLEDVHEFHFVLEPSDTLASYEVDPESYSMALKARALQMKTQSRDSLESGFPGSGALKPKSANQDAPNIPDQAADSNPESNPSSTSKSLLKSEPKPAPKRP